MQKGEKEKVPETEIFGEVRGGTEMSSLPTTVRVLGSSN